MKELDITKAYKKIKPKKRYLIIGKFTSKGRKDSYLDSVEDEFKKDRYGNLYPKSFKKQRINKNQLNTVYEL